MAINDANELHKATRIAMAWVVISLVAAVSVGFVGRAYWPELLEGADAERIYLLMSGTLFSPFVGRADFVRGAGGDHEYVIGTAPGHPRRRFWRFYKNFVHRQASERELINVSRLTVLLVALCAISWHWIRTAISSTLWRTPAGFGAVFFGPVMVLSLFWRRMTRNGALAGMLTGGITVLVWALRGSGCMKLCRDFVLRTAAIVLVSLLDTPPEKSITDEFDRANARHILWADACAK